MGEEHLVSKMTSDVLLSPRIVKLLDRIVGMQEVDAQVAFALLRVCVLSRVTHLVHNVPPARIKDALSRLDALSMRALAAVMQEPSATESNDDISSDWVRVVDGVLSDDWDRSTCVSLTLHARCLQSLLSRKTAPGCLLVDAPQ